MIRKPNAVQKFLHRFFMLPSVTAFFSTRVQGVDRAVLRLTKGRHTATEILGWDIVQLITRGAKSGQPRSVCLLAVFDGDRIGLIASSFGRQHNPAWYYNLKAHPECHVQWKGRTGTYRAREVSGEEYRKYWQLAVACYQGYESYMALAPHRMIPIMVLEPQT